MGVTVQEEHDGLEEEDRSDPEGRGARGPARPDVWSSGEEEHERTRPGRSRIHRLGVVVLVAFLDREVVIVRIVIRIVGRLGDGRFDELGLGLGVDLFRLFDHRGLDDEARLPELRGARAVVSRRARSSTYLGEGAAGA